jgi:beta-lactamase regulating signal transducer with metallopeptidase domain
MIWLPLQTVAQISAERILNALPEGFLIALFAWMLLRVLRRQNSGTRFAVWFLALLTVAALPLWSGFGRSTLVAGMPSGAWGSMRPTISIPAHWAIFVFIAWLIGVSVAMLRLAAGLWRLRQLRQSCTPILASDLHPALRKTVDAIGASGSPSMSVTIATSESVRVPAAIGFWKRTIVLPAWALRELPPEDLNVILLHESAHLRRWDDWTNLIQKIVRALFFFHPAVWWIENRLSVEREMACDDVVLAETANPHGYATCLVSLLEKSLARRHSQPISHQISQDQSEDLSQEQSKERWSMVQAAVHRAREASMRLAQILDKNRPAATRVWKPALGMVSALSVACLVALSNVPQFVAFDRGVSANASERATGQLSARPASVQPSLPIASVVPAKFVSDAAPVVRTPAKSNPESVVREQVRPARVPTHSAAERSSAEPVFVAFRLNTEWSMQPFRAMNSNSKLDDQQITPLFRTLVFIQTTQYEATDTSLPEDQVSQSQLSEDQVENVENVQLWRVQVRRVQVWRVIMVGPARDQWTGAAVINSI